MRGGISIYNIYEVNFMYGICACQYISPDIKNLSRYIYRASTPSRLSITNMSELQITPRLFYRNPHFLTDSTHKSAYV